MDGARCAAYGERGGVTQFLDIGTGIPTRPNLHEIAQGLVPSARIVYVDNDPVVLRHAEALLTPISPEGRSTYLQADLRDPRAVLESPEVTETLDMTRPVGLVLAAILHFLDEDEDPAGCPAGPRGRSSGRFVRRVVPCLR